MKKNLIIAKSVLQSAVCSLQSAVCSLRSAVCSLRSAVCSLRSAFCSLPSAICSLRFHPTVIMMVEPSKRRTALVLILSLPVFFYYYYCVPQSKIIGIQPPIKTAKKSPQSRKCRVLTVTSEPPCGTIGKQRFNLPVLRE